MNLANSRSNQIRYSLSVLMLLFFLLAESVSGNAQKVVNSPKPTEVLPSYINMPIRIGYDKIDKFIDSSLNGVLYVDSTDSGITKVVKQGTLRIVGKNDSALVELPVKIWYLKKIGPVDFRTDFDLMLLLSLKVSLNRDWKLLTQTRLVRYEVTRQPVAHLASINWDFSFVLNQILKYSLPGITTKVDKSLANSDMVSKYARYVWQEAQRPMLVDSTYQAWLSMHPLKFYYIPIRFLKKEMLVNAAMDFHLKFGLGSNQSNQANNFTNLSLKDTLPQFFATNINIKIPIANIDTVVRQALKDTVFALNGRKKIKVDDIRIQQNDDDKIVCRIITSGSYKLDLQLNTDFIFSDSLQLFYAENLDFTVESEQILINTADVLFKNYIKKRLAKALQYDPKADLLETTSALSKFLDNYNCQNKLLIQGELNRLSLSNVKCEKQFVTGVLSALGKAQILLTGVK